MRTLSAGLVLVVLSSAHGADPDARVKERFKSENYTVTWGTPAAYEPGAELEIGTGDGHGGTLRWVRFRPGKDGVEVLSVQFDEGRDSYKSKWPPDRAPVVIERAALKPDAYAELLSDLAAVGVAKLKPVRGGRSMTSTFNFWVYARLATDKKTPLELNWAGYMRSAAEIEYAKPNAAVGLALEVVEGLKFEPHTLADEDRAWATAKFIRDWKLFEKQEFHWWVRERYIQTIGVVGDKSALPALRGILATDPPVIAGLDGPLDASDGRCVYYAINAATRLLKRDVRGKPVEEMDIEKTRRRVLDLIKDEK